MKLKNVLLLTFLTLTLIPIAIVSLLLYKSGFELSKKSYARNLVESINVQVDYISQTIENNMISDYRFANRKDVLGSKTDVDTNTQKGNLLAAFQSYLQFSEDKITVCLLMDDKDEPIYTIGEKAVLDSISTQLPDLSTLSKQLMMEFKLGDDSYSLGIITPVHKDNTYLGSLISIYDKAYIFKIISSYYEVADTSTYICRKGGDIINFRGTLDVDRNSTINQALKKQTLTTAGAINMRIDKSMVSGYYKKIHNTPWYLAGFVDENLIFEFTNQFAWVYILIIVGVLIVDISLSFYFSRRVVKPINGLIEVMEGYKSNLNRNELQCIEQKGYYETKYLQTKFLDLMGTIMLVQHNFEGVYQLYQSNDMGDINIDIDVKMQTAHSSKEAFQHLMDNIVVPSDFCIVERFIHCFCEDDQPTVREMLEGMRDEHLAVTREAEFYTPYLNEKWFHTLIVPMYENDRLSRLFIQLRDISSFKKQEFASTERASRDSLTGLYNRAGFMSCVETILKSEMSDNCTSDMHGLLFIDMDFFKLVNDNLGHSVGDELLRSVSEILLSTAGVADIVSRFGGDEFAVFMPHTTSEAISEMKKELNKLLYFPYATPNISFAVYASIGISTWDHSSPDTLAKLLEKADASMYKSKREFKKSMNKS